MTNDIPRILGAAREQGVFSGAAWSYGDASGAWNRGTLGTLFWEGPNVFEDSYWDLASVSKPIVAMAVLSLVESGELSLEDTVGDYLPEYPADKTGITVRQLLTHTSGLPGQVPLFRWNSSPDSLLRALCTLPLATSPGSSVTYSSQGYMILGFIAETASGHQLDDLVTSRVFRPAGMKDSSFGLSEELRSRAVATENDPWRKGVVQGEVHDENAVVMGRPAGHAGIFSTLPDMEKLGQALCAEGMGETDHILSPAGYRAMILPRTDHLNARWTLGWTGAGPCQHGANAGDIIGRSGFGHTGFTGTSIWVDPDTNRYSVLLTNRVHPSRTSNAITRIRKLVNNIAFSSFRNDPNRALHRSTNY